MWDQAICNDLCKKGLLREGSTSSRLHLHVSWIVPWLILASGHRVDSCAFPFADLLLVRGTVLLPPAPPVFSDGWHKGQFGTFREKYVDSLRSPFTVKLLEKRIPANSFVILSFPRHIPHRSTSHFESSNKQRTMQFIVGGWWFVCTFCVYMCVFHLFLYSLINSYW